MDNIRNNDFAIDRSGTSVLAVKETNFMTLACGRELCYAEYGDPAGRPLMYFHGWPSSRLQGFPLDEVCKEYGVRLIAPDRPGVGKSDLQPERALQDWPEVVAELADYLKWDQFLVIGVSGGGPYAVATAAAFPERVERAAVVCGAPPLASFPDRSAMMWPYRALLAIRPRAPFLIPALLEFSNWVSKYPVNKPPMSWAMKWTSPADRKAMENQENFEVVTRSFREGISPGMKGITIDGDIYTSDWGIDFEKITVPIEFWHGDEDRNIPFEMVKEYASWIPSAEPHFLTGEGHYSMIDCAPREVVPHLLAAIRESESEAPVKAAAN